MFKTFPWPLAVTNQNHLASLPRPNGEGLILAAGGRDPQMHILPDAGLQLNHRPWPGLLERRLKGRKIASLNRCRTQGKCR